VVEIDAQGRIVYANEGFARALGVRRDTLMGARILDFYPDDDKELLKRQLAARARGENTPYEISSVDRNGQRLFFQVSPQPLFDDDGAYSGSVAVLTNITELRQVEEALRRSETMFRSLADNLAEGLWRIDEQTVTVYVNPAMAKMLGYEVGEMLGRPLSRFMDEKAAVLCERNLERRRRGIAERIEFTFLHKDGSPVHALVSSTPVLDESGRFTGATAVLTDLTAARRIEATLRSSNQRLKLLAAELSAAEERERDRIAVGLHDDVIQPLVFMDMQLAAMQKDVDAGSTSGHAQAIARMRQVVAELIERTRTLTFDLPSAMLREMGLEAAIEQWLVEQVKHRHGIETIFEDDGGRPSLSPALRGFLFRAVRELLTNTVKHARATKVRVSIRSAKRRIRITVCDNGIGFDPDAAFAGTAQTPHLGLSRIRERLWLFGGSIEVERDAEGWMCITLSVLTNPPS